ncbi:MAG: DegT/DnrJ/EryC1/StrS family aminotransferase [Candidatus Omnitrophota bacterium]
MNVAFIDVKKQNDDLKKELVNSVKEVLDKGDFILGEQVRFFEKEFALYCGTKYAVGVNSGTDALFLALLSAGVGPGDEVICPVYTYIATALSISYIGAKPVFADIDPRTFNMDPSKIEKKITKKTKVIIPVHLYGQSADMLEIMRIARKYKLAVIEDAAQAQGALHKDNQGKWRKVGAIGDAGCFSFYPTKNLGGCGDAGIVLTNKKNIYNNLLMLRDQGRRGKQRYLHYVKGYNSRLDSIQAAILQVKLKCLDDQNKLRQAAAIAYTQGLKDSPGVLTPFEPFFAKPVFHIYALRIKNRDKIYDALLKQNIHCAKTYHCPLHLQPAYKELKHKRGDFPIAEQVSRDILCLPMHANLSKEQVQFIINQLKKNL